MGGKSKSSSSSTSNTQNFTFTPVDNRVAESGNIGDSFVAGGNVSVTQTDSGAVADALNFAGQASANNATQIAALTGQALDASANNVTASFGFASDTVDKAGSLAGNALKFSDAQFGKSYDFVSDAINQNYGAFDNVLKQSFGLVDDSLTLLNEDRARNTQSQESFLKGFSNSIAQQTNPDTQATCSNLNTLIYAAAGVAALYALRGVF